MKTSIDSNVFVSLWDVDSTNLLARKALDAGREQGSLIVCGAVYAELLGGAGRTPEMLDKLFAETTIEVDWRMDRQTWELAGLAYRGYCARLQKRKQLGRGKPPGRGRQLTDSLIGAHAVRHGLNLITLDKRIYRAAFPQLHIVLA